MSDASTSGTMSPELLKVAERAKREPEGRFHSLAHLLEVPALERAYHRQRKSAAVGVDGITKETYGQDLEARLRDLHARLKSKQYRHQPIRRVHIPKDGGKTRPIGIAAFEDKVVQDALREVLEAIYEQDFVDGSYGFRPGRSAHDALRALDRVVHRGEVSWILEADIVSFFDSVDRTALLEMLQVRVADGSLLRLVGKCLHVGVFDGEDFSEPDRGTTQGSVISPILANIYLHYVLDLWFEREVKPRLRGRAILLRYADDFAIGFERQDDAERVMEVLPKRMARYGLALHPDKTRLLCFRRPPDAQTGGKGPATFDFLGFTLYWRRTRGGRWGALGDGVQDPDVAPSTVDSSRRRLVSSPSTPAGQGAARRAHETDRGPHQLLRGQRQRAQSAVAHRSGEAVLVEVAPPSEPANSSHLGKVRRTTRAVSFPAGSDRSSDLGSIAASHTHGRAGWWKSPCPDLARAPREKSLGATLQRGLVARGRRRG